VYKKHVILNNNFGFVFSQMMV